MPFFLGTSLTNLNSPNTIPLFIMGSLSPSPFFYRFPPLAPPPFQLAWLVSLSTNATLDQILG